MQCRLGRSTVLGGDRYAKGREVFPRPFVYSLLRLLLHTAAGLPLFAVLPAAKCRLSTAHGIVGVDASFAVSRIVTRVTDFVGGLVQPLGDLPRTVWADIFDD